MNIPSTFLAFLRRLPFAICHLPSAPPSALGLFLLVASPALAQFGPGHTNEFPDIDLRTPLPASSQRASEREAANSQLIQSLPSVTVDFDAVLDTPKFIRAHDGFLSGPNGQGRAISAAAAQAVSQSDPYQPIKAFILSHHSLFGHGPELLNDARLKRDYTDSHNGLHTVAWEQKLDGIPVFQSVLLGHITKHGELTSISSTFIPGPAAAADSGTPGRSSLQSAPPVSAAQALVLASQNIGDTLAAADVVYSGGPLGDGDYLVFKTPQPAYARLVWLPLNRSSLRLAWEVIASQRSSQERFLFVLDAQNGSVLLRQKISHDISDATYNVYTSDSPSPFSPGLQTPGTFQPPLVPRTLVTTPALDTTASPNGWINDGDNTTTGNNIDAFVDRNFDQVPDRPRPVGNPNRVFNFTNDLTLDPTNYIDASTTQLFYRGNWYHDRLYELGFTEAAGNYQVDNFGRGGLQGDNIICYVQAGASVGIGNNSFFVPAPDGFNGQCFMFVFTFPSPARDGSLDSEVVIHELTHGTSWRLVGGGFALGSLQGNGMGEGWSDFYALALLGQPGDDPNAAYPMGGYVTYRFAGLLQNYYFGIRHFPYCTDMSKNPFTFKDIDPGQISPHTGVPRSPIYPFDSTEANEVHHQGEVWCSALWEVHANLVQKYGFTVGNELALQLVTDGMKLTPAQPTFLQARDGILLADQVDNGGANLLDLWRGFAKRGMGFSASSPDGSTTAGVVEAFDIPGLQFDNAIVNGGNGNGVIDNNECNDLQIFVKNSTSITASGVTATLSCSTPGVIIAQSQSAYSSIPAGATNSNLTPFKVSTTPDFVCGTPISFTLEVKSAQVTTVSQFTLHTGFPGTPIRFDNLTPAAINDVSETNSPIVVSNISSALVKVTVGLYITHTFDADLLIQLVSPDGTTNTLSSHRGGAGDNFGASCGSDSLRTIFDDSATIPVASGSAPFIGSFQPDSPLSVFVGKSGTNVNGTWLLHVADQAALDVGVLHCWSLSVTPTSCTDGGGECPGSDLAIAMDAQPNPVSAGNNLTYIITVTNNGPATSKTVSVSQQLPSPAFFVSATPSQGGISQSGGVLTWSVGQIGALSTASCAVVVEPTQPGPISSTAVVSSSDQVDPNTGNNVAAVNTQVNPPTADIGLTLRASPSSVVLGNSLTYSVIVTNNGPDFAPGVSVTNILPAASGILSAVASQGTVDIISNNIVVCTMGQIDAGAGATATIQVLPTSEGSLVASANVVSSRLDPILGNNSASVTTTVGPSADLALGFLSSPNSVVTGSNLTYTVLVTNLGPSTAVNVAATTLLPTNVTAVISAVPSQGSVLVSNKTVTASFGTLLKNSVATNTIIVASPIVAANTLISASTSVTGGQGDPVLANNAAAVSNVVSTPFIAVAISSATLTAESFSPPDGAIENGETVTVNIFLRNVGNVATTNLIATLLTNSGVTPVPPNNPQHYVKLLPSPADFPVARPFSFTASGGNGATLNAVLHLTDNGYQTNLAFSFALPNTLSFSNTNLITIRDTNSALPYPSSISVSNLSGTVGKVTATLVNLTHTFVPQVDALLVNPAGQDTILMSGATTYFGVNNATITFDDAATDPIPCASPILSGSYKPADCLPGTNLPPPAPQGPYVASMAALNGSNPNGLWSLFVDDHGSGDTGNIAGGWSLALTLLTPINRTADIGISASSFPNTVLAGAPFTNTFVVTNSGPNNSVAIAFTNLIPANVALVSSVASQGTLTSDGTNLIANLGSINAGNAATVIVVLVPSASASGTLNSTASAVATSGELDLNPANNTASSSVTVVLPSADLAVAQSASPNLVTVGSNITFALAVTNNGPQTALGPVLTSTLGSGLAFVSAIPAPSSVLAGTVTWNLSSLSSGAGTTITLVASPSVAGSVTNILSAASSSSDAVSSNNTSTLVVSVAPRMPQILPAGATLVTESGPINGGIDLGETVTVSFALRNVGSTNTPANFSATLLPGGGVSNPSSAQTYGTLLPGGPSVSQSFSFTATGSLGGTVTATLQLANGVNTNVVFTFSFPAISNFANASPIIIPDHGPASPYPSIINVSGMTGLVSGVTVTLNGFTHSFPRDVSALLVSPSGSSTMLMSHAGGSSSATNLTFTFSDSASTTVPFSGALASGTYHPTNYSGPVVMPNPAPAGPYGSALAALNGNDPNGTWSLFVLDDSGGDSGVISSGWSLSISTITLVNPVANLGLVLLNGPSSVFLGDTITNVVLITNLGPSTATSVVLTNLLPGNLTFVSSSPLQPSGSSSEHTLTFPVGPLSAHSSTTLTLAVYPTGASSVLTNIITVSSPEQDLDLANNTLLLPYTVINSAPTLQGSITSSNFIVTGTAPADLNYALLVTTNLASGWTPLSTNTATGGLLKFIDTNSPSFQNRFYRTVRVLP